MHTEPDGFFTQPRHTHGRGLTRVHGAQSAPQGRGFSRRSVAVLVLAPTLALGLTSMEFGSTAAAQGVEDTMTTVPVKDGDAAQPSTAAPQSDDPKKSPAAPEETTEKPAEAPPSGTTQPGETSPPPPKEQPAPPTEKTPPGSEKGPQTQQPEVTATEAAITPFLVPAPSPTTSVITVSVAGDRTSITSVSGLSGVTLQLYGGGGGGPSSTPRPEPWATCVSDANGDCSFIIPETQDAIGGNPAGANRNARFWIKQTGAPTGYFMNTTLATGTSPSSAAYQFRTGNQLQAGITYRSTAEFMIASGSENNASGGIWQTSRDNPTFPQQCGIRVALVVDLSGSVSPYISQMREAAKGFVDSLTGTPSQVALFTFAANAPAPTGANLASTTVATAAGADTVKNQIDTYTAGGSTNWDRGIYQVAASATPFDVAIVLTDGNPTSYAAAEGPGNRTRFREVENGIFSANAVKLENTKVIAFGVGNGINGSPDNLRAISGPVAGSDYYQTSDYAEAGAALRELALGNCAGSVSVVKQLVPSGNTGEDITGAVPAEGWNFTASTVSPGVSPSAQSGTTNLTGAVNFPLEFSGGTTSGVITLEEAQQPGYTLVTQGGNRAVCVDISSGNPVPVVNDPVRPTAFTVTAPAISAISCTVFNRPPQPLASLAVAKTWVVNGVSYADGAQPVGLHADLTLGGTGQAWGSPRTGLTVGSNLDINETTTITGRDLCAVTSQRITARNGAAVDLPLPYTATIGSTNSYTVTNTVTCSSQLTLAKSVQGGTADPSSWTLDAIAPSGALPGPNGASGSSGATAAVTPETRYPLAESDGSPLYTQSITSGGNPQLPSTGSWQCVQVDAQGTTIPGFADGINGAVIVPLGFRVQCTAVNQTASLTLIKQVINDDGGTRSAADWNLTATPTGSIPAGLTAQTVTGSEEGETISVRPGTSYALSESGVSGYALESLMCSTGPNNEMVPATTVTVAALDAITCVFVNTDQAATLSLVKVVDNGATGATTAASAWSLSATGTDTVRGAAGSPAVTSQPVAAGTYALAESGPGGYDPSAWVCTGATEFDASSVTLAPGENATCTITNTAIAPTLTLEKEVQNSHGGSRAETEFPLTASGPTTVSGFSGTPSTTAVPVPIGSYTVGETNIDPIGYALNDISCTNRGAPLGTSLADPTLELSLGDDVVCTLTNEDRPATLTLIKEVEDAGTGSTRVPADWTLTATPNSIVGQDPVSGNGTGSTTQGGIETVRVFAGDYLLSENGPSGFDAGEWRCEGGVLTGSVLGGGTVTVPNGGNVICTITNTAVSPTLTLVKLVENGSTGGTATPADWTLTGSGPTPVSGTTGDASITGANVQVGSYDLSEVGAATGYSAGAWSCDAGVQNGSTITLAEGDDVTCTIVNTAVESAWTVSKTSSPPSGSTVLPGREVTYTLTATHTAGVNPVDLVITDDLSDVLDDASFQGAAVASNGDAELTGTTLAWSLDTLATTATVTYTVRINDDAFGATLHNVVTPPEGSSCVGSCETTHVTPAWRLTKSSDPVSGSLVDPSSTIVYTLHALNTSDATVTGATALDDLREVLDEADLVQPLAPGLSFDPDTRQMRWDIPTMAPGSAEMTVSYAVTVHSDAFGETLLNVATPGTPGGECPVVMPDILDFTADTTSPALLPQEDDCDTTDRVRAVDLQIEKSHAEVPEGAVDSGKDSVISYTITVTNAGLDPATEVTVSDPLPAGLSYVEGTLVAPAGWTAEFTDGVLAARFGADFAPGDTAVFTFDALVGELSRASAQVPFSPIVNTACVAEHRLESDKSNNCASVTTPVKSIAVTADAVCRADTPFASYSVTPFNVTSSPTVSLIWWTLDAYENRDPAIDAGDTAALLADGASQVDPIDVPDNWTDGTPIEGTLLWPGAAVDAAGNPIAWPGWTQNPDGSWVLDPAAPFYNLRAEAVMEIRINPSTAAVVVYPPATPNCAAVPPTVTPPGPPATPPVPPGTPGTTPKGGGLAWTGSDASILRLGGFGIGILALALGIFGLQHRGRRSSRSASRRPRSTIL